MTPNNPLPSGTYKFTVTSTEKAVTLIRERLGPTAKVLSVRPVAPRGFARWFRSPQLEVVAAVETPGAEPGPRPAAVGLVSAEPAIPSPNPVASQQRIRAAADPGTPRGLASLLQRSGLTESAIHRLQAAAGWRELHALPLHRALAETSRLLQSQAEARPARGPISRAAFLGSCGVGRTTALCKWLAQETFKRAKGGHVVSVEFDQPNPLGPLPVFTEALGVPLAHFPCETGPAMPGGFVYFDLPGVSVRRPADNAGLARFLDQEKIRDRVLVLNAAYDRSSMRAAYAAGRDLGATHLVFTHLDEVPQWGKLWDFLFDEEIEPLFLATGPSLTGDIEEDVAGALARRTLPSSDDERA